MLTPEQIDALADKCQQLVDPVVNYLIADIVRRILEAGKATPTAKNQAQTAASLGVVPKDVKTFLETQTKLTQKEIANVYKTAAQLTWAQSIAGKDPRVEAFAKNEALQNIVKAMTDMATDKMENITQTIGMIGPYGNPLPLRSVYTAYSDYALQNVAIGGESYQKAMMDSVKGITKYGIQVIDYQSGQHANLDVAVRRNIFGGLGLMVERIEEEAHDQTGADGWEISAHYNSAEDHEPYQGRQYTDAEYRALNGTPEEPGKLRRRISTLNCKHIAFPIIIGVNQPQYTAEQLREMKQKNADGITFQGRHYTGYEATQMQRALERQIRATRRNIVAYEQDPSLFDKQLTAARAKHKVLEDRYKAFSQAAGLRTQERRLEVIDFGPSQMTKI
ncbi:MAG: hypothetical protein KBS75_09325 [Bacteroidales bacterium]|nr:hypothetical protein [Candidatus Equimonas faecalis]